MVIDLFAGMRAIGATRGRTGGGGITKMVVEVSAPEFKINLDDAQLAGAMAVAVADQMRANIMAGAKLDGTPAPPLAPSTIVRREYRRAQGRRGGAAVSDSHKSVVDARFVDKDFKKKVKKHWKERFTASRLGTFNPASSPAPIERRAVESGLLLASIAAEPKAGGIWTIYFANVRAQVDRSGNSPVGRALGMTTGKSLKASTWDKVVKQPGIKKRLEFALKAAVQGKNPMKANILAEIQKTVQHVQAIADTAEGG